MRARRQNAVAVAALLSTLVVQAAAAPAREAAKLERRQVEEARKARALAAQAADVDTQIAALSQNLAGFDRGKLAADSARASAEETLQTLHNQQQQDAAQWRSDREALETFLIGFLREEPAAASGLVEGSAARSGALVGFFSHALAARAADKQARIVEAAAMTDAITLKRETLIDQAAALERAGAQTQARLDKAGRQRAALTAEAQAAAARSAALARQARDLRELAEKVSAAQKRLAAAKGPSSAYAPGGKRVAPVAGAVITAFGAAAKSGAPATGVTLGTAAGAQILAPVDAVVGFAGPFRSYGHVLILDQGDGYAVILTGLDQIFAGTGQKVAAGAPIGRMASGAITTPELYFEVREAGRPIDPERWLRAKG